MHPRVGWTTLALAVAALASLAWAVSVGDYPVPLGQVLATLVGQGQPGTDFVVLGLRLPRAVCALAVGAALGAAGSVFQSITRNPLGSPDIIGFTQGAAVGAVLQILVFRGSSTAIALGAVAGGLVTTAVVLLLAGRGGPLGYRLILVGIGVNFLLVSFTWWLMITARLEDAASAQVWLIGSLNGRGWSQVWPVVIAVVVLVPVLTALSRPLAVLEMGDDVARGVGVAATRTRVWAIALAVVLTGAAVATAGPIAFVALAAPQLARRLTGATGPAVLPAALMGGFLLVVSDIAAQRVFAPTQLPVGIATGVVGGCYLAGLLVVQWRRNRG
ncbi:iron chelate uptake ABC transporter family permease subunit [Nakamurella sp. YIM 132084]|uniref:Iron chelate uptake ABC transporter family permease subunit n=2 Tax=Nakamurella leprariae TaxID=2803911 RepID=A0A938YFM2_9ACTN|nr:iron chelate uptake ABC transporter family permease subunit [Nakamurella leprariae]